MCYLLIGITGKSGPYMCFSKRAVRHSEARVHCSVRGARCRHARHCSRSVRHSGGDGKHLNIHAGLDQEPYKPKVYLDRRQRTVWIRDGDGTQCHC